MLDRQRYQWPRDAYTLQHWRWHILTALCLTSTICTANQQESNGADKGSHSDPGSSIPIIDCHPDRNATASRCARRGCLWRKLLSGLGNLEPQCYFNNKNPKAFAGYDLVKYKSGHLQPGEKYRGMVAGKLIRRNTPTLFGSDYQRVTYKIDGITSTHLTITISGDGPPPPTVHQKAVKMYLSKIKRRQRRQRGSRTWLWGKAYNQDYEVLLDKSPFGIAVRRKATGALIFDSRSIPGFTMAPQYLQISTRIPTNTIYGFGEHQHKRIQRNLNWTNWGIFAKDHAPNGEEGMNLYGSHPFFLGMENSGHAYGILLMNSHGMNIAFQPNPNIVTYRVIGGLLEFHIFLGSDPNDVIRQYTAVIGRSAMPPYWGLGYQLCRYGYKNLTYLKEVWNRNRKAEIPQDVQYIDIDYMDGRKDFTYDKRRFKGLPEFVQKLHSTGQKLVLIVDPVISANASAKYIPLSEGLKANVFVKDGSNSSKPFMGVGWPGHTYWPDFTAHNTPGYWAKMHQSFWNSIHFDGVWNDMNEPANSITGSAVPPKGCRKDTLNYPPYNPLIYEDINSNTICMDAKQHAGLHYSVHNIYGYSEVQASYGAMKKLFPAERPFVLTRSSFPGTGSYAAHWTGDIRSSWPQLHWSIIAMLDFNLFGIPWVGADICGFEGNTTEELCVRWHQVGAFYPFSRNHNDLDVIVDQDPAAWSPKAIAAIRSVLLLRYQMLPYLYTLFYKSHTLGDTVVRPLSFEWPTDKTTWSIDTQFLWGSAIMIAPILQEGAISRDVYFPAGKWFHLPSLDLVSNSSTSHTQRVSIPLNESGVFLRAGFIIPHQKPEITTTRSRRNPLDLYVALSDAGYAQGSFYWDDGVSSEAVKRGKAIEFSFAADKGNDIPTGVKDDGLPTTVQVTIKRRLPPIQSSSSGTGDKTTPPLRMGCITILNSGFSETKKLHIRAHYCTRHNCYNSYKHRVTRKGPVISIDTTQSVYLSDDIKLINIAVMTES